MALPFVPAEVADRALGTLQAHLVLSQDGTPPSHVPLVAAQIDSPEVPAALGAYVVAVAAGGIEVDCQLSDELAGITAETEDEVRRHFLKFVGVSNTFHTTTAKAFRDRVRNPWLAEMLVHALLVLRSREDGPCLTGSVLALKLPHLDPRRTGLDTVGIYDADGYPAAVIGEVKASKDRGRAELGKAVEFFREVDAGDRGTDISSELRALKVALPGNVRSKVADGYWRERRTYLPAVAHSRPLRHAEEHEGLGGLKPTADCRRLLALRLATFHAFFDDVADGCRSTIEELFTT